MLEKENVAVDVSTYLVIFIPLALGRIICGELNINFTDEYEEHLLHVKINKGLLSRNSMYVNIFTLSMNFILDSNNKALVLKIDGASPELKIINEALLKNLVVNEIKFSTLHVVM